VRRLSFSFLFFPFGLLIDPGKKCLSDPVHIRQRIFLSDGRRGARRSFLFPEMVRTNGRAFLSLGWENSVVPHRHAIFLKRVSLALAVNRGASASSPKDSSTTATILPLSFFLFSTVIERLST